MTKKLKIPIYKPSLHIEQTTAPLVIQEGSKFPWEFIELRENNIPKSKSRKFKSFYKEKRVYKPRPVYETFDEFPDKLKEIFTLATNVFEYDDPDWIRLKRFLNDKSPSKMRWLWGFSLRHRGTEKIKINQNDLLVIMEWNDRTGKQAKISEEKLYIEDKEYVNRLEGIIRSSKVYGNGKSIEWLKKLYLLELQKENDNDKP